MVQGAGLTSVNGTYASFSNVPFKYIRRGNLPGFGMGTFVLQTRVLQDDSKKWFLSFAQGGSPMHTLNLYSSPVHSDADPPPMQNWLSVTQGHEKIRQLQTRTRCKNTSFESSTDDGGDPPPICIWLPNDSA